MIDDNEADYRILAFYLSKLGIEKENITHLLDLQKAVELLKTQSFHLIFLDVFMPKTVLKDVIFFLDTHPKDKIVIYSGCDEEVIEKTLPSNPFFYLSKMHLRIADLRRIIGYAEL